MDRQNTNNNKIALEQGWLDYMMRGNPEWAKCRSTHRIYVQQGLPLTVWQHGEKPTALGSASINDIQISFENGIELHLDDIVIGAKPIRLAPHLFIWIPAFSDVRYAPSEHNDPRSRRRMTVPICMKSLTNPERDPLAGAYYLSKQAHFYSLIGSQA